MKPSPVSINKAKRRRLALPTAPHGTEGPALHTLLVFHDQAICCLAVHASPRLCSVQSSTGPRPPLGLLRAPCLIPRPPRLT